MKETILLIMDVQMESDTVGGNNTEPCLVKCVINFALQVLIWQNTFFFFFLTCSQPFKRNGLLYYLNVIPLFKPFISNHTDAFITSYQISGSLYVHYVLSLLLLFSGLLASIRLAKTCESDRQTLMKHLGWSTKQRYNATAFVSNKWLHLINIYLNIFNHTSILLLLLMS